MDGLLESTYGDVMLVRTKKISSAGVLGARIRSTYWSYKGTQVVGVLVFDLLPVSR